MEHKNIRLNRFVQLIATLAFLFSGVTALVLMFQAGVQGWVIAGFISIWAGILCIDSHLAQIK